MNFSDAGWAAFASMIEYKRPATGAPPDRPVHPDNPAMLYPAVNAAAPPVPRSSMFVPGRVRMVPLTVGT